MKKLLIALLITVPFVSMNAQTQKAESDTINVARIHFKKADEGTIGAAVQESKNNTEKNNTKNTTPVKVKGNPERQTAKANSARATFPGGERAIREFVKKNMRYPDICKEERITGRVIVTITIKPDGTPADFAIHKSSGNTYMDKEALRVAHLMPMWTPAEDKENGTEFKYFLSFNFRPTR